MYIKLKWTNQNVQPVTTRIYRNDTAVDKTQLGTPLVTLTAGETEWNDPNVVRNATYYYTFETIGQTDTVFSNPIKVVAVSRTGPGPQQLQFGDLNYGYFGSLLSSEFFAAEQLVGALGVSLGGAVIWQSTPIWDKWARNGKICYFPQQALYKTLSWKTLYDQGLVYGVDGPGPNNAGTNVNQLRTVRKGLDRFLVRLPTGVDDRNNPTRALAADILTNTAAYRMYSEVADFFYPISVLTPPQQRAENVAQLNGTDLGVVNTNYANNGLTQELNASKQWLTLCLDHSSNGTRADLLGGTLQSQTLTTVSWRPVVELIDSVEVVI